MAFLAFLLLLLVLLDVLSNLLLSELLLVRVGHVVVVLPIVLLVVFLIVFNILLPSLNIEFVFCVVRILVLILSVYGVLLVGVLLVINHKLVVFIFTLVILLEIVFYLRLQLIVAKQFFKLLFIKWQVIRVFAFFFFKVRQQHLSLVFAKFVQVEDHVAFFVLFVLLTLVFKFILSVLHQDLLLVFVDLPFVIF